MDVELCDSGLVVTDVTDNFFDDGINRFIFEEFLLNVVVVDVVATLDEDD